MSKEKIIERTGGTVTLDKQTHIYQLDTSNGKITKANLVETGKGQFKLIEFDGCMYLPASSMEIAQATFAVVFKAAKSGKIKLSWREKLAKWWTVINFKIKQWKLKK